MNNFQWYVLKVFGGQEEKLKTSIYLEAEKEGLREYIEEILIPSEKVFEMYRGKKCLKDRKKLPGYLLISANLDNNKISHTIGNIFGVLGFLGVRGWGLKKDAKALRKEEVDRMTGKIPNVDILKKGEDISFVIGEKIKIINGPFNTFEGDIQDIFPERKKVNVEVKIFGRNTPVELSYNQVQKKD